MSIRSLFLCLISGVTFFLSANAQVPETAWKAAQEEVKVTRADGWVIKSSANLTHTQNAFSDNWEGNETGSLLWAFASNTTAKRKLTKKMLFRGNLKLAYGQSQTQNLETREWTAPNKSTDLIDFENLLRFTLGAPIDPFVSARLISQFYDARGEGTTFNPMTITESAGIAKQLRSSEENDWLVRFGVGLRQHFDRNALLDTLTLERGSNNTQDGGLELVNELTVPLFDNAITLDSKLTVFQALYYSESGELTGARSNYWKSVDINFENIFTASITKVLMVNLYTQLLYDKEVDLGGRFRETLSLGLTFILI
ncbi:DUF3078 domain-containing protein [bacterium]|nr:DUF3078 domain-containing protein [bacterium]